ncbi:MAG TPA: hypothetical protein VEK57_20715 [Thermoanaerobaculia bacterium]|nr:hypothetical protein [Thermoanaerobaculia bacterium]
MSSDLPASVDLAKLTDELESVYDGATVYVNGRTGEIVMLSDEDVGAVEDGETDFEPEGGDEELALLHAVVESDDWVAMPDKFEIHEWQIMSDFADEMPDLIGETLAGAIRGRGAFRMFRDAVDRLGIHEEWFDFKRKAIERLAIRALESENIPYHRGRKSPPRRSDL